MCLKKVIFAKESLWETLNQLAKSEKIMFAEKNSGDQETGVALHGKSKLKRLDELFVLIEKLEEKIVEFGFELPAVKLQTKQYIAELDKHWQSSRLEGGKVLEDLETKFRAKMKILEVHLKNLENLLERRLEIVEKIAALKEIQRGGRAEELASAGSALGVKLQWIVGLVPTESLFSVQKLIFRIAKENVFMRSANLGVTEDSLLRPGARAQTLIWICAPRGEEEILASRISAVLAKFGMRPLETSQTSFELKQSLVESAEVIEHTQKEISLILREFVRPGAISSLSRLQELKLIFRREENFAKQTQLIVERNGTYELTFWVPSAFVRPLIDLFDSLGANNPNFTRPKLLDASAQKFVSPPTKFALPELAKPFQLIVDTYGTPRYKEANPGLFTIATFPFMFGLMFGDIGHGAILLSAGIYLAFFLKNKLSPFDSVKYVILLMGIFALFSGFIYNDFFSVPMIVARSCYHELPGRSEIVRRQNCVYPFGMDYMWFQASNETLFFNSFKMKFAIIAGVLQMLMGIGLKWSNAIYFRRWVDLFFEAVPQMVFMLVTFGYMVFCIVVKWLTNWTGRDPPSIISLFINYYKVSEPLYSTAQTQTSIQRIFILLAFVSMILMFFPKPIILHLQSKSQYKSISHKNEKEDSGSMVEDEEASPAHDPHAEEGFGELMVHQMIETVEFVLGSISNTASYLRLWALSLAHAQLSKVFLTMIFSNSLKDNTSGVTVIILCVVGYLFWALVTFGIIMGMDLLECFLHALRLHWVEFQNKFFKGDGKPFEPFMHAF